MSSFTGLCRESHFLPQAAADAQDAFSRREHLVLTDDEGVDGEQGRQWELREICQGPSSPRGPDRLNLVSEHSSDTSAATDGRTPFERITTPAAGSLLDVAMKAYLLAAREWMRGGPLTC